MYIVLPHYKLLIEAFQHVQLIYLLNILDESFASTYHDLVIYFDCLIYGAKEKMQFQLMNFFYFIFLALLLLFDTKINFIG